MKSKFNTLFESNFTRFQGGGFLTGDVVKLKSGWNDDDWCKSAPAQLIDMLNELDQSDLLIRVSSVKPIRSAVNSSVDQALGADDFFIDIVQETAPGRYTGKFVTVPQHLIELSGDNTTIPEIPDSLKREEKIDVKPVELEQNQGESQGDVDQYTDPKSQTGTDDQVNRKMTDKDIERNDAQGAVSYTAGYIN